MRSLANYDLFLMPRPLKVGKRIIDMTINTKRIIDDQYRGAAEEMLSFQAQLSRRLAAEMMVRQQVLPSS